MRFILFGNGTRSQTYIILLQGCISSFMTSSHYWEFTLSIDWWKLSGSYSNTMCSFLSFSTLIHFREVERSCSWRYASDNTLCLSLVDFLDGTTSWGVRACSLGGSPTTLFWNVSLVISDVEIDSIPMTSRRIIILSYSKTMFLIV